MGLLGVGAGVGGLEGHVTERNGGVLFWQVNLFACEGGGKARERAQLFES